MESLIELSHLLDNLMLNKYVKINIHLVIEDPLLSFCLSANQEIDDNSDNDIVFGNKTIIVPHVSLAMGYINSVDSIEQVFSLLSGFSSSIRSFIYQPKDIYLKGISSSAPQYVFMSSFYDLYIKEYKSKVSALLDKTMQPLEWNNQDELPHLTLGRCRNPSSNILKLLEQLKLSMPSCRIQKIGVSLSGKGGVCLGNLKTFALDNDSSTIN